MEGLSSWNVAGRVGPIHVPSFTNSNFSINVSLDMVTPPATIAATQPPADLVAPMPPLVKNTKA
jgi:hypothetical protein